MASNGFLNSFLDILNNKGNNKTKNVDPSILDRFGSEIDLINYNIDKANNNLENSNKRLEFLLEEKNKAEIEFQINATEENEKRLKVIEQNLEEEKYNNATFKSLLKKFNDDFRKKTKEFANNAGVSAKELKEALDEYQDELENNNLGIAKKSKSLSDQLSGAYTGLKNMNGIGGTISTFASFLGPEAEIIAEGLRIFQHVINDFVNHLISLNDKLIQNMRNSGGVLTPQTLGMDKFGSNLVSTRGSITSQAANNGLEINEILEASQSFNQGAIYGGANFEGAENSLQRFSIQSAKIGKLYNVNIEQLKELTHVLTQEYGVSIDETTDILNDGAKIAKNAGINVGKFFENLSKIAEMQSSIYTVGGINGIEKVALALTKFGLTADVLSRMSEKYQGFGDLVVNQQKLIGLGLNRTSAIQEVVFAKLKLGDQAGALELRQIAAAQDIKSKGFLDAKGKINTPGIETLKAGGYQDDEIKSIQRLISGADRANASLEAYVRETDLTIGQLAAKRNFEKQDLKTSEKLTKIGNQFTSTFLDPIVQVTGPAFDTILSILSSAMDILKIALTPVTLAFQLLGKILTPISDTFTKFSTMTSEISESFSNWIGNLNGVVKGTVGVTLGLTSLSFMLKKVSASNLLSGTNAGAGLANAASFLNPKNLLNPTGMLGKIASNGLKGAGTGAAIGAIASLPDLYDTFTDKDATTGDKVGASGKAGLKVAGGVGGAILGTALLGPGFGTYIGGMIGEVAGDKLGDILLDKDSAVVKWFDKNFKTQSTEAQLEAQRKMTLKNISFQGANTQQKLNDIMATRRIDNNLVEQGKLETAVAKNLNPVINVITNTSIMNKSATGVNRMVLP